jgi:hypothetical protein
MNDRRLAYNIWRRSKMYLEAAEVGEDGQHAGELGEALWLRA